MSWPARLFLCAIGHVVIGSGCAALDLLRVCPLVGPVNGDPCIAAIATPCCSACGATFDAAAPVCAECLCSSCSRGAGGVSGCLAQLSAAPPTVPPPVSLPELVPRGGPARAMAY